MSKAYTGVSNMFISIAEMNTDVERGVCWGGVVFRSRPDRVIVSRHRCNEISN